MHILQEVTNNLQEVLKSWNEIFSESDKKMTKNMECSVNIHSFHVHCCFVLLFPVGHGKGGQEASLDTFY